MRDRLEQLSSKERAQIEEVAIDTWKPYDTVCTQLLPNAAVTVNLTPLRIWHLSD
ncbi:transposase [Candidatus Poribacteria bacterium]|nr:transposase [Candidatus Poribacteria bacterium]